MLQRLGFPRVGRHRRFVSAIGIDAVGSGVWMPVSMLYFLAMTPLSVVQVGAALSLASLSTLPLALVVGSLVDRYGAKRVLQTGNLLQAVGFALFPLADTVAVAATVIAITVVGRTAFWGSYAPLVTAIAPRGEREKWFGFLGALRNAGFAIGGLLAAAALTVDTPTVFLAVVWLNATSYLAAWVLMRPVRPGVSAEVATTGEAAPRDSRATGSWAEVWRDVGYRWLTVGNFAYAMSTMVLTVAIPIYVVEMLGLPGWVAGAFFVINTVMIGVGQGLVVQGMTGARRWRIVALAAGASAVSMLVLWATHLVPGTQRSATVVMIVIVLGGSVIYTAGEMIGGPVLATLAAESPPPESRGRYLAVWQLSWNTSAALAPILYAWLLAQGATPAWLAMAAIAASGGLVSIALARHLPLAREVVTNRAVRESDSPSG